MKTTEENGKIVKKKKLVSIHTAFDADVYADMKRYAEFDSRTICSYIKCAVGERNERVKKLYSKAKEKSADG